jgi:hypothetical protein
VVVVDFACAADADADVLLDDEGLAFRCVKVPVPVEFAGVESNGSETLGRTGVVVDGSAMSGISEDKLGTDGVDVEGDTNEGRLTPLSGNGNDGTAVGVEGVLALGTLTPELGAEGIATEVGMAPRGITPRRLGTKAAASLTSCDGTARSGTAIALNGMSGRTFGTGTPVPDDAEPAGTVTVPLEATVPIALDATDPTVAPTQDST